MSSVEEIRVPDLGEIDEVDVVEVLVAPGDRVGLEDPLITLESDKATMDVPAPRAGKVREVKVKAGDKVGEGALILLLEAEADVGEGLAPSPAEERAPEAPPAEADVGEGLAPSPAEKPAPEAPPAEDDVGEGLAPSPAGEPAPEAPPAEADVGEGLAPSPAEEPAPEAPPAEADVGEGLAPSRAEASPAPTPSRAAPYASPSVRRLARELGVDLARVKGTGRKARILKEDVQGFVQKSLAEPAAGGPGPALPELPVIDFSRFGEIEAVPLTRIQKVSGPHLHRSWLHVPHVTQHDEADITELEAFRKEHSAEAEEKGFKLTPVAFVMKAAVKALKRFPGVNASLDPDGEQLILKKYYHLGIAVDTPGGLVVPVIRDVDQKGIFELAEELAEISGRAREGKLKPDEIRGASFTVTSLGGIGGTFFTPIVNSPEVAILGVSRSRMAPLWKDGEFVPRLMLPLSLSYDHRVVDGAQAVRFTTYLCEVLADIRRLLL